MFGHLSYILNGVTKLGSLKPYYLKVSYEDTELEGEFIYGMVSNTVPWAALQRAGPQAGQAGRRSF